VCFLPGIYAAGALALFGAHDLPVYIDAFKSAVPLLVYPTKLIVSFPFVYHTLAGIRHLVRILFPLHHHHRYRHHRKSPPPDEHCVSDD
jgi:succinate dehydrogenase/fumarate reductase cytochrome b subunit